MGTDPIFYNIQGPEAFWTQLDEAPAALQDEFFSSMTLEIQSDPRQGIGHAVIPAELPNVYHMLFDDCLAWITYAVFEDPPIVNVYKFTNARDTI